MQTTSFRPHLFFLALALFVALTASSALARDGFLLVNQTGYEIRRVFVAASNSNDWGANILQGRLPHVMQVKVTLNPRIRARKWDVQCQYADGEIAEWKGLNLAAINRLTLYWSRKKGSSAIYE